MAVPIICPLDQACVDDLVKLDLLCNTPPWTEAAFSGEFANDVASVWGLRFNGQLVGFLVSHSVADESHIMNFGIDPTYRGEGFGRFLLEGVLAELREQAMRRVTLEVRVGNIAALQLYLSVGFMEVGVREGYYSDNGEDALVLALTL